MTKADIQQVKQRFGIIGNTEALSRAIDVAIQVAPNDLSVLITGESGTGKENGENDGSGEVAGKPDIQEEHKELRKEYIPVPAMHG